MPFAKWLCKKVDLTELVVFINFWLVKDPKTSVLKIYNIYLGRKILEMCLEALKTCCK